MPQRTRPAPWIVGLGLLPFGLIAGFTITALPFLLTKSHVPLDKVAEVSATVMSPTFWGFLLSPILDLWFTRRTYSFLTCIVSAICLAAALLLLDPHHLFVSTALFTLGELSIVMFSNAQQGWVAEFVPDNERGPVGGWTNAANLGGGALGAMLVMQMAQTLSMRWVALAIGAFVLVSLLPLLWYPPAREPVIVRNLFRTTMRDIWVVSKRRETLIGFLIFLSPAAAAAGINLFSGLGSDFHTAEQTVIWITGAGCAISASAGSLIGGYLCSRVSRARLYLLCGIGIAITGAVMAVLPHGSMNFEAGVLIYNAVTGVSYAAFTALALQLTGTDNPVASTQMALFSASTNFAITYMTWADGQGYRLHGVTGLLFTDALASSLASIPLLLLIRRFALSRASE